jgi:hypothetical protein
MADTSEAPVAAPRTQALRKLGIDTRRMAAAKPRFMTDLQRAKALKVEVDALKLPIVLSPARMVSGNAHLTLFSAGMVETTWPEGSGQALFSSSMQGASFPGAQIAFPRTKKGKHYLVEFSVVLFGPQTFNFRVFDYPLGGYQDVALPGNRADILTVLVPPIDSISGALEFGAGIQQRDPASEAAGWALYSVRVSTTS